jgi:hypothetical protein
MSIHSIEYSLKYMLFSPFVVMALQGYIRMPVRRALRIRGNTCSDTDEAFKMSYASFCGLSRRTVRGIEQIVSNYLVYYCSEPNRCRLS